MILLDTHIWIWLNMFPQRIPTGMARQLADRSEEFAISSVSIWEAVLLLQRGRIQSGVDPITGIRGIVEETSILVLPIDAEVAFLSRSLKFDHADPADRFIAATAFRHRCPLATLDEQLRALSWLQVL